MAGEVSNNDLYTLLLHKLNETSELINDLMRQMRDNEVSLAEARTELAQIRTNLDGLSHVVRDDNGSKSLITRLTLLETMVSLMQKQLEEKDSDFREGRRMRWEMVVALVGALLGAAAVIFEAIYVGKHG
jgi:chromosome condensin MukBEF ATPase and DNA-binding subunit MukB